MKVIKQMLFMKGKLYAVNLLQNNSLIQQSEAYSELRQTLRLKVAYAFGYANYLQQ